jgi:uncharacterized protein (UPF0248 family)
MKELMDKSNSISLGKFSKYEIKYRSRVKSSSAKEISSPIGG